MNRAARLPAADASATLTLRPGRWRQATLLAISALFVGLGALMILDGERMGWLVAGFFGLGIVVAVINLLPGASHLRLTPEGMAVRTLFRHWSVRWADVQGFSVTRIGTQKMVVWNHVTGYTGQRIMRRLSTGVADFEAALPDTYGLPAQALADLLNRWRHDHRR